MAQVYHTVHGRLHDMSWIDYVLSILFPAPVSITAFDKLPPPTAHEYEPWVFATTRYKSDARKIIRYLKSTPDQLFIERCAKMMAESLESYMLEQYQFVPDCSVVHIVPIPQHKSTTKARGFSQSELLAKAVFKRLSYTQYSPILQKIKKTEKQALLPRQKRLTNQHGAYVYAGAILSPRDMIVLIDDVSTTGSTLRECKKVLQANGFKNIIAVVFAH